MIFNINYKLGVNILMFIINLINPHLLFVCSLIKQISKNRTVKKLIADNLNFYVYACLEIKIKENAKFFFVFPWYRNVNSSWKWMNDSYKKEISQTSRRRSCSTHKLEFFKFFKKTCTVHLILICFVLYTNTLPCI